MNTLVATVSAYTAVGLLLTGGIAHSAHPRAFRSSVSRQALWPAWSTTLVVAVVITLELVLGAGGMAILATRGSMNLPGPTALLITASGVYLAFTAYSVVLLLRRPGAPCGCSHADSPINLWVPVRSATVAVVSLAAAAAPDQILPAATATPFLMAVLAVTGFVIVLWSLPVALDDPDRHEPGTRSAPVSRLPARSVVSEEAR